MTSDIQHKIYVFFDTNMLENRFNGDCLNVSLPKFSDVYFYTKNFIIDNHLESSIKICIPEIVLMEIKKHLIDCYKSQSDSLNTHIDNFKKIFGDMYEITANKKICQNSSEYINYIDNYFNDILKNNSSILSIIPYPRDNETFEKFVYKAMHSEKPFTKAKVNGKEYTDAGLKDAIIYETLLKFAQDKFCILVSKDNDFKYILKDTTEIDNIKLCDSKESLMDLLIPRINLLDNRYKITQILSDDDYFIQTLLFKVNFKENANYKFGKIITTKEVDDGTEIIFTAIINGENYIFDIVYEINANEIVEIIAFGEEDDV